MSRTFVLQSVVFSVSLSLLAACAGGGGSTSGPLPQTGALAVGAAQRSVSSNASKPSAVKYTSLYSFKSGADGSYPTAGLIDVKGTLYGTTTYGGASNAGTVFAVSTSGTERVLYTFEGGTDSSYPEGRLIDVNGVLYGTTEGGGTSNAGTVFAVSTSGKERVLYSFKGGADGSSPYSGLIDVNGALYGTTVQGGASGAGTVFQVSTSGTERVLYSFKGAPDAQMPAAGLIDVNGALYGTAGGGVNDQGTVFKVSTSGTETVLYSFKGGADGSYPFAGLIDVNGTLYGTTLYGGANSLNCCLISSIAGTVFAVSTSGAERVLYSFKGGTDGSYPYSSLTDVKGELYGTTEGGGANICSNQPAGCGTVFEVNTAGTENVPYNFGTDGGQLRGADLIAVSRDLYGTTYSGGANGFGTVFRVSL
jgi:uncharacterized repeat protein (TIGR03803 family)